VTAGMRREPGLGCGPGVGVPGCGVLDKKTKGKEGGEHSQQEGHQHSADGYIFFLGEGEDELFHVGYVCMHTKARYMPWS